MKEWQTSSAKEKPYEMPDGQVVIVRN